MSTNNPYSPPSAEITGNVPGELASRWKRLFGAIIDSLLVAIATVPLLLITGVIDRLSTGAGSFGELVLLGVLGFVVFFLLNGHLLRTRGQTIGKLILGTQIVSYENDGLLPLGKVIGMRYVPLWLAGQLPFIGGLVGLVNSLFIFGAEKRCGHDHIAGTKVINYRTAPVAATTGVDFR